MANLTSCSVIFGVPTSATDNYWKKENILFVKVQLIFKTGHLPPPDPPNTTTTTDRSWIRSGDHRNTDILPGQVISIGVPFTPYQMANIDYVNLDYIELWAESHPGKGDPDGSICRYRFECILEFSDGKKFAQGYNDPARSLICNRRGLEHYVRQIEDCYPDQTLNPSNVN